MIEEKIAIGINDLDLPIKPSLFDINKSFDSLVAGKQNGLVGEEEARMVIFTNFILGEKPVIMKGSRASGKTSIMRVVNVYARNPVDIASSSEKAYQRNKTLNEFSHFIIPEINKVNEKVIEMLKDFGEDEKHQYSFTNPYKEVETIIIDPKPFITSIADENKNVDSMGEELLSRVTVVRTNSSVRQNINVIEEKFKRAKNPFVKQKINSETINNYIAYVKGLPSIRQIRFIYPAGESIRTAIPPLFTDSRRDTDKYLSNTYGITLFHMPDRMMINVKDQDYLFVTPVDMWYNHVIYQNILLESSLKCGKIEHEILDILSDRGDFERRTEWGDSVKGLKVGEIHTELLKKSYTPTIDSVTKMCNQLMEIGYVTRNEEVRPYRYQINPELNREYSVVIDWRKIVLACVDNIKKYFPDQATDYINRYCEGAGLEAIHPFTGERVSILDEPVSEMVNSSETKKTSTKLDLAEAKRLNESLKADIKGKEPIILVGESDSQDTLQENILSLCSNNEQDISLLAQELVVSEEIIQSMVDYLCRIGDLLEIKPGRYQRL